METNIRNKCKAYTSLEQSKKLAEFLPLESADMRYGYIAPYEFSDRMYEGGYDNVPYPKDFLGKNPNFSENDYDDSLPCWSLAALLGVLPNDLDASTVLSNGGWDVDTMEHKKGKWLCDYVHDLDSKCHTTSANNPIDACYEMILKLHEQKML